MAKLFYPQLSTGAIAQYPLARQVKLRTIKNAMADGTLLLLPDSSDRLLTWRLNYSGLTELEVSTLQQHFAACRGPLTPFTFLDPTDNLFVQAADLTQQIWLGTNLIAARSGIQDPNGSSQAFRLTNTSQATLDYFQSLQIPSGYQYCLSGWARAEMPTDISLFLQGSSAEASQAYNLSATWRRLVFSGKLSDSGQVLNAGLKISPGAQVDVFGLQLEAQVSPSAFKATTDRSGVYQSAYWATDELFTTANGPNQFAADVLLESYF